MSRSRRWSHFFERTVQELDFKDGYCAVTDINSLGILIEYWGSGRETTDGVVGLEALAESVVGSGPGRTLGLGILDGFDFLGVVDGTVPPIGKLFEIFFPYKAFFRSILSRLINDLSERI
ncbi:unnamed protein product [Rhizophagus irregularis]|nr:unnamed protein product [Rhizophagus irregularis]